MHRLAHLVLALSLLLPITAGLPRCDSPLARGLSGGGGGDPCVEATLSATVAGPLDHAEPHFCGVGLASLACPTVMAGLGLLLLLPLSTALSLTSLLLQPDPPPPRTCPA